MEQKRTMSQILIDADNNSTDFNYLRGLISEISKRSEDFTKEQMEFMREHFNGYIIKIPNYENLVMEALIGGIGDIVNRGMKK